MKLENKLKTMYAVGAACLALVSGCGDGSKEEEMSLDEITAVADGKAVVRQEQGGYDRSTPEKAFETFKRTLLNHDWENHKKCIMTEYYEKNSSQIKIEEYKKQWDTNWDQLKDLIENATLTGGRHIKNPKRPLYPGMEVFQYEGMNNKGEIRGHMWKINGQWKMVD